MKYLIEIEPVKEDGDFKGNGIGEHPWTPLQLQKAIAYDLVRIRRVHAMPFQLSEDVVVWTTANSPEGKMEQVHPLKGMEFWKRNIDLRQPESLPDHRPEFG